MKAPFAGSTSATSNLPAQTVNDPRRPITSARCSGAICKPTLWAMVPCLRRRPPPWAMGCAPPHHTIAHRGGLLQKTTLMAILSISIKTYKSINLFLSSHQIDIVKNIYIFISGLPQLGVCCRAQYRYLQLKSTNCIRTETMPTL